MTVRCAKRKRAPPRVSLFTAHREFCSSIWRGSGSLRKEAAPRLGTMSPSQNYSTCKFTSPEGQHSENSLDFALYAVVVHVGASIRRGHYVAYVKDPRGEWFQMDDHKASSVSLSEVLQVQAYMLFYIQTVHRNAGIDSVNQQTEQVSDSMDEDGTLVADETLSLPDSKTLTGPEQVARYSAPTVAEPAEEPLMSHAIALEPPAVSGWKTPVPGEHPTKVESSVSILDMSGVRINYLPSACEHIQSLTDRGSTAQGAPLHEDRTDSIPTVPPRIPPASRAEPTSPEVPTASVFRQQPPQPQTPLVERPQPIRADRECNTPGRHGSVTGSREPGDD